MQNKNQNLNYSLGGDNFKRFLTEHDDKLKEREAKREQQIEEQRKKFARAMTEVLDQDQEGEYNFMKSSVDKPLDEYGRLTQAFKDELRELKEDELIKLEESIKNARLPTEDIFGIKRRFCSVCEQGCIGYQPSSLVVPQTNEFPTFCKNCKCPAHFHQIAITPEDIIVPAELQETIKNYNIKQKDVNFNALVLAFQVREEDQYNQNLKELVSILTEEGLEILSMERRYLEVEECLYFKNRMVGQSENLILQQMGLQPTNTNIKRDGYAGSSQLTKGGQNDPYLMNLNANKKEKKLTIMQQQFMAQQTNKEGEGSKQKLEQDATIQANNRNKSIGRDTLVAQPKLNQENLEKNKTLMQQSINQRVPLNDQQSIARTSNVQSELNDNKIMADLTLFFRNSVLPKPKDKNFKLKTFVKNKTQVKSSLIRGLPSVEVQYTKLAQEIEVNPVLKDLIGKEVVLLVISSSTVQNLENQIKTQIISKITHYLPSYEMPLLYISDNKIIALEDCITFFPQLFKLTKSIVITEPLIQFGNQMNDVTIETALRLSQADPNMQQLQKKLTILSAEEDVNRSNSLMDQDYENEDGIEDEDDGHFFKNRRTLMLKVSQALRQSIVKRETLRKTTKNLEKQEDQDMSWVRNALNRDIKKKKVKKLVSKKNRMLFNYGIMHDFFNYSAMSIQNAIKEIEMVGKHEDPNMSEFKQELALIQSQQSNIFAIAKIGLPNLILPNSLDIKLSNYNTYASYLHLSDIFFPQQSNSQHSVLVLRPIIVKNGLNDSFVQILKVNDFTILKRKVRLLSKSEVIFLAEIEGITNDKKEFYYNLMMDGETEIIVVTKLGAVEDLKSIVDGSRPNGRRRISQLYEDQTNVRSNVDAVNAMFEITPFTSISEFLDLEDFIVSHTKLEKYRKLQKKQNSKSGKTDDQLYFYKIDQIRKELNLFTRFFNIAAHASPNTYDAQRTMCILMPETAIIEEAIIILNPIYNNYYKSAERLILRMGFKVLSHKIINPNQQDLDLLFKEKILSLDQPIQKNSNPFQNTYKTQYQKLIELLKDTQVHMLHLTKISGDREIRQLYKDMQIEFKDLFKMKVKSTPFRPLHFPLLFLFMDTPYMFEQAHHLVWGEEITFVTGNDLAFNYGGKEKIQVLENALQATVGDKILELAFDKHSNILDPKLITQDSQHLVSNKIPQIFHLFTNAQLSTAVHFVVESEAHGLYEIRYTRLPIRGDVYSLGVDPKKIDINYLKNRYFTKFQVLNYYYNEVSKHFYNVVPAFYRFKVSPLVPSGQLASDTLNRVYEVEEYMGKVFIEDIANQHQDHIRMIKSDQKLISWQLLTDRQQQSLPVYIWGLRIAKTVKDLERIKANDVSQIVGAGRIRIENGQLKGEVKDINSYYEFDKKRFMKYLDDYKQGWNHYISTLESDLIESKLMDILNSVTFKHSRKPENLSLIPDRMQEINLRISAKIKLIVQEGLKAENTEKFFTHLKEDLHNPHQEEKTTNFVSSIMNTLYQENLIPRLKELAKRKEQGYSLEELEKQAKNKDYSVHKDVAVVGVDVAKRPKYQLIASIMYLINFWLRKIERRTQLFIDLERQFKDFKVNAEQDEKDYDQILDILLKAIYDNYGDDEVNQALDMVKLFQSQETDFEKMVREKHEREQKIKERLMQRLYEEQRQRRTQMTIDQLIKAECTVDKREYEMKQRDLLRKFVDMHGYQDYHGDGFLNVLKDTQTYLGPYSIKLAHDYLKRFETQAKQKQEKISFVKMEYFLYAFTEGHRCIQDLKQMENRLNEIQEEHDKVKNEFLANERTRSFSPTKTGQYQTKSSAELNLHQRRIEHLQSLEKLLEKIRYQTAYKETELVLIMRELMSCDYYVPDYYFDMDYLKEKQLQEFMGESYVLPMRTFWRPIHFDAFVETDLLNQPLARLERVYPNLMQKDKEEEKKQGVKGVTEKKPYQGGVLVSALRPYDIRNVKDIIRFDRYISLGQWKEHHYISDIKDLVKLKTTKGQFNYNDYFKIQQ